MRGAERSQGIDGQALVCQGGCVEVIGSSTSSSQNAPRGEQRDYQPEFAGGPRCS